jgi:ADP-L-glycero-D-manno-heptose 6-epimerase
VRVLVTGSAGFIGRHVADALEREGWTVVGVDLRADGADFAADTVLGEVEDGGFRAVVHQAAIVDTLCRDRALMVRENSEKALLLAEAARLGGASFVYASSASVYGTPARPVPLNPYAESKLALDHGMLARRRGRGPFWAGLRYTNVFGPGEGHKGRMASMVHQLLERTAAGQPLELFDDTLDAARDWMPVGAVADRIARMLAAEGPSGIYDMGSGVPVSFGRLVNWCEELAGERLELRLIPNPHSDSYQYWTRADPQPWDDAFGEPLAVLGEDEVRAAAGALYAHLVAEHSPAARAEA